MSWPPMSKIWSSCRLNRTDAGTSTLIPKQSGYCYWTWRPVTRDKSHWLVCSDGDFGTDPRYADGDAREYEGFLQRRAGVEWTSRRKLILDNLCWIARSMFKDSLSWEYCGTNQDKLKKIKKRTNQYLKTNHVQQLILAESFSEIHVNALVFARMLKTMYCFLSVLICTLVLCGTALYQLHVHCTSNWCAYFILFTYFNKICILKKR